MLVSTGNNAYDMLPNITSRLAPKRYGGHGLLPLGEYQYKISFVMVDEADLSKLKEKFGGDEAVESRFMHFGEKRVYQDFELIALATLFTAGGMIPKFLHVPLHRVRVARFPM